MAMHQANCEICKRIAECREGRHPGLIAELDTGFAVLGDSQHFLGYAILLCKTPATELDELDDATRARYLEEMAQLAAAVRRVVQPHKLNYECLGNHVHHLHFHIFPRQLADADPKAPVWGQMHKPGTPEANTTAFSPIAHADLLRSIKHELSIIRARASAGKEPVLSHS
jgi:diadenosine tetraphosphate (Ap4A) HIT family hydrolase